MKAITTRFHGPTDTKGARISASDLDGNRISISYPLWWGAGRAGDPHELSEEAAHRAAAEALCRKMGWAGKLAGGAVKNGYCFVFVGEG